MADRVYSDGVVRQAIIEAYMTGLCSGGNVMLDAVWVPEGREIGGSTSDGYHTFDELYEHRATLFSVVVAAFPERSWKSLRHADGSMYDGMFIVGIDTPDGQATYHYDVEPWWPLFHCRTLDSAPEWDGHTAADAMRRLGGLRDFIATNRGEAE